MEELRILNFIEGMHSKVELDMSVYCSPLSTLGLALNGIADVSFN